jgi:ferredoxin
VNAHIVAKRETCIGAGQCVFADPDAFDQDDDGWVVVLQADPASPEALARAKEAVNVCPSRSISVLAGPLPGTVAGSAS